MNVSWLVAQRELKERIKTRSFIGMAIAGPLLVMLLIYILFSVGILRSRPNKTFSFPFQSSRYVKPFHQTLQVLHSLYQSQV
jgi:ABC-type Na+ efflux pump permease subunit